MSKVFSFILKMIDHPLNWHRLHNYFVTLLLAGGLMIAGGNAHAESRLFEGVMEYHDGDPMSSDLYYANVNFSLTEESIVSLYYTDYCQEYSRPTMTIHNAWGETSAAKIVLEDTSQPWGPLPLAAGTWTVRVDCGDRGPDREPLPPFDEIPTPYKLTVISEPGQSQFAKDSEYTPVSTLNTPITLSSGKTYSGWLGYVGYEAIALNDDDYYHHGIDGADNYYFQAKAGTKIIVKLQYDPSLNDALRERDIGFITYRVYQNGNSSNYVPWDVVTDLNTMWQTSGDVTKEFTIPQDGTYLFSVFCGTRANPGNATFPRTNYGGYRMSVIVNGDDPLKEKGMEVTVLEATWRKKTIRDYINGNKTQHYLEVKLEVENKNNETKTMQYDASVFAPMARLYHTPVYEKNRKELIDYLKSQDCQYGRIDWDDFCTGDSEYKGICEYIIHSIDSPNYTIPAHSKKQFTAKIPVDTIHYEQFDNSFQVLQVEVNPTSADDKACYMHGISFWPIRVIIPAIRLLLDAELGD